MAPKQKPTQSIEQGTIVCGCRVEGLLGHGGMGEVYLAEHLALKRPVAIKTLRPDRLDHTRIQRFLKEAQMAARVDHPNVITIYDVREERGTHFIIMQYVDGRNLADLVRTQGGFLHFFSALKLIRLAAKGLYEVHRCGLIHRDVKPSNIMLASNSRVVLMDFGLVREQMGSDLTGAGELLGTPEFMSPEQCRGEKLDARTDIYSLGATLYFLIAGRAPFKGKLHELITTISSNSIATPLYVVNPQIPRHVSDLVATAMSPRREDRFADAATMGRAIRTALRSVDLPETESFETSSGTSALFETQTPLKPEQPTPLELVPLPTFAETLQDRAGWLLGGAATLVVIALLAWLQFGREPGKKPDRNSVKPGAAGAENKQPQPNHPGMVHIEAGMAQLGNDPEVVRTFVSQFEHDAEKLDNFLSVIEEEPRSRVKVPAFWIDRYEVTNAEYAKFLSETGHAAPDYWSGSIPPPGRESHPVVDVSYDDAQAYADWAGKKLPTREQWVRAARGDRDTLFPWGNTYDVTLANVGDNPAFPGPSPVKQTPKDVSPMGVYNLVGNVHEFIRGSYRYQGDPYRMMKGANWHRNCPGYEWGVISFHTKYALDFKSKAAGFRCVIEE